MAELSLLYKKRYEINENIKIVIPTVGEIMDDEDGLDIWRLRCQLTDHIL